MKNITIFYRQMNYKNSGKGIVTLQKSLKHSLRVTPNNPTKNLEWDDSKSAHNQIYLPEQNKVFNLDSLSQEERVNIISNIIDEVKVNKKSNSIDTENKNDLGKYKAKLNKILKASTDNPELYNYLNNIINSKTELDSKIEKNHFGQFELTRKNQKIECLGKFIELHNKVLNPNNTKDIGLNEAVIQEAVFKIPARNEVEVSLNDIVKIQSSFYKKNFPDYQIKAIAIHGDESDEHSHIFVSTKNKKTNKHDLLKAQYRFVEKNIDEERLKVLKNEPSGYKRKKLQAEYFQVLFYAHANETLNNEKYKLNAKVLEKTEENKARMRVIEEDAKRPKIDRQFNFNNLRIKKQMNNIRNLDKKENQLKNSIVELDKKETAKKKTLDKMDQEEITKQNKLDEMDREEVTKRNKLDDMDKKLDKLTTAVEFMTDKYHRMKDSLENIGTLISDFIIEKMSRIKNSKTQIEIRANINKLAEEFGTDEPANEMIDEFAKQSDHRVKQDVLGLKRPKM
ncbi:hypothetical protein NUV89_04870 [Pseudomonas sp. 18.1.10]|uniref:hypothetical protein n=1 Tax=Pseudomonas sp. 18.1.10 TaxID=2969302 RepID=UPI0021501FD5|nr:hypothetical protein [Pseudomonas sp. 18.1.10]MCR4537727.1 hypothetical protein [Pseudomonas sp. 18.1.10]